jgi:flagellar biosynthesis anti-sigma factor FlgM
MRIDLHYGPQVSSEPRSGSAQNSISSATSSGSALPGEDEAVLSGAHVQVAALAAQASQLPEVREERVQSLRLAVANGEYTPDPQKVAGAMMAHLGIRPVA